ncbi:MAG: bifunctional GNAT family N-acetyltransferase/(deoxy)nucleoside triphosphate pyrophosphohydrolase [Pseudomonadota bacterium]
MATSTSTPIIAPDPSCSTGGAPGAALLARNLRLRPLASADAEALSEAGDDPDIARWMADLPSPFPLEAARAAIARARAAAAENRAFDFGIERIRDGALMGWIELRRGETDAGGEITLWLGRAHWRKGFATEALNRLTRFAFQGLGLGEVRARVLPANAASARVFIKAGFAERGMTACGPGGAYQARLFVLSRDAWTTRHAARPLVLVAAVALVDADGRVLVARRPEGKDMAGLWEFPGGKVGAGEMPEAALIRELAEELSLDVRESCLAAVACASHDYDQFQLLMPLYACRVWKGAPAAREGQEPRWVMPARLSDLPMPPADAPLVSLLRDLL